MLAMRAITLAMPAIMRARFAIMLAMPTIMVAMLAMMLTPPSPLTMVFGPTLRGAFSHNGAGRGVVRTCA